MEYEGILYTLAQIAVALTGFTGIVAVLGHRNQGSWSPGERLQLRTLVETSLTVLFASLAPVLLFIVFKSEPVAWRGANAVLGLLHLSNLAAFLWRARNAKATTSQKSLLGLGVATITAHFLAVLAVLPWVVPIFILGLIQQILIAALNFVLLLFPLEESSG